LKGDKASHQSQLIAISAQLSGIPAANQKEQLDKRGKGAREALTEAARDLRAAVTQVRGLLAQSRQLLGLPVPHEFREVRKAIEGVGRELAALDVLTTDIWHEALGSLQSSSEVGELRSVAWVFEELQPLAERLEPLYERLVGPTDSFVSAANTQLGALATLRERPRQTRRRPSTESATLLKVAQIILGT
jgi:hypothetical protein